MGNNLATHKRVNLRVLCINPIEQAFSKLKAHLRRIGARSFTGMFDALTGICELCSSEECRNDFKAAGYVSG